MLPGMDMISCKFVSQVDSNSVSCVLLHRFHILIAQALFDYATFIGFELLLSSGPDGKVEALVMGLLISKAMYGKSSSVHPAWRAKVYHTGYDSFSIMKKLVGGEKEIQISRLSKGLCRINPLLKSGRILIYKVINFTKALGNESILS